MELGGTLVTLGYSLSPGNLQPHLKKLLSLFLNHAGIFTPKRISPSLLMVEASFAKTPLKTLLETSVILILPYLGCLESPGIVPASVSAAV